MKIKTTKKMRLDELIQYIFDNGIEDEGFIPSNQSTPHDEVRVSGSGNIKTIGYINKNTTFTVEVEEELTEETELERITIFFYDTQTKNNGFGTYRDLSIQEVLEMNRGTLKFISMAVDDVLIWSRESGIPESGVLEVDMG